MPSVTERQPPVATSISVERALAWLLRGYGLLCLLALGAVIMPQPWMAAIHGAGGLGEFPSAPITEYLARATSALCAFVGALLCYLSTDVHRYRPLIRFQSWAIPLGALVVLTWMAESGRLFFWLALDAAGAVVLGIAFFWLTGRLPHDESRPVRSP